MNSFLHQLLAHKGGLICLKSKLYWYDAQRFDEQRQVMCLILDASTKVPFDEIASATTDNTFSAFAVRLLIRGAPHWVWLTKTDVEILNASR